MSATTAGSRSRIGPNNMTDQNEVLTLPILADRCAAAAGISPEKAAEVLDILVERIGVNYRAGELIHIEGFGIFRMGMRTLSKRIRHQFWPDDALIAYLNTEHPANLPAPAPIGFRHTKLVQQGRGLLTVHPLRQEDAELIDRWGAARRGTIPEAVSTSAIYLQEDSPPPKVWAEDTVMGAQRLLRAFARRVPTPLRAIGLKEHGLYTDDSLRSDILLFAKDYEMRAKPRLERYLQLLGPEEQRKKGPLVWRTGGWLNFVEAATEFYNWLERQGLRPKGSNPFRGIRRLPPLDLMKGKTVIVEQWYRQIMDYPHRSPKQVAILHLLASGMRAHEVASVRIDRLTLAKRTLTTVGKNGKIRTVHLFQRTVEVLDQYLKSRAHLTSPWLFPGRGGRRFEHLSPRYLESLVRQIVRRVFPHERDAVIRSRISPHKFRHFYVSDSLHQGMNAEVIMQQVGHGSRAMIDKYTSFDPAWVEKEVRRIEKKKGGKK